MPWGSSHVNHRDEGFGSSLYPVREFENPFSVAFRVAVRIVPVGSRMLQHSRLYSIIKNKKYSTVSKSPAIPFPSRKGRTVRRKEPHYPHIVRTWAPTRAKKGQYRYGVHPRQRQGRHTRSILHAMRKCVRVNERFGFGVHRHGMSLYLAQKST